MNKPKNITHWATHKNKNQEIFYIVSKINDRTLYFLYNENWEKLSKSNNPLDFKKIMDKGE